MPTGNLIPQAQDSNAAGPANAEADARHQENPVEPPAREPIGREENMANYVEPPVPMGSLYQDNEPHSNGHPPMQGIDDEQVSPPQPDLGLQALSVNPPIQLMVRSDLQNWPDARVSSLSVEIVGPGAGPIYASAPVVPAVVIEAIPVQSPVPAPPPGPAPAPAPGPAPAPPPAPVPNPAPAPRPNPAPRPAPAGAANFEADQDNSSNDPVEEGVSSLSSSESNTTTTSTDSSDEDNIPLSFYNRGPFPKNGTVYVGFTGRLAPGSAAPASGRFVGQPPPSQPIQIPPPSRAVPLADRWITDDESSDPGTEPVSKRRRQMGRRE